MGGGIFEAVFIFKVGTLEGGEFNSPPPSPILQAKWEGPKPNLEMLDKTCFLRSSSPWRIVGLGMSASCSIW